MNKRRRQSEDDRLIDSADDPIGLTGAFEVYRDPQSVEYDETDEPIGLTEAFGRVLDEDEDVRGWDEADKWKGFDWEGAVPEEPEEPGEQEALQEADSESGDAAGEDPSDAPASAEAAGAQPAADAAGAVDVDAAGASHADAIPDTASSATPAAAPSRSGRGKRAAHVRELSPSMKKSRRTRKTLIVIVVLLVLVIGALGYFMYRTFSETQQEAAHHVQQQQEASSKDSIDDSKTDDNIETATVQTTVPKLTGLFGKTTDEAVAELGHGAIVVTNRAVKEKGSPIRTEISIALTEEPADSKTGTPTVYLGLDKKKRAVQVGYSASASALGFGSLSFADAVTSEHVVEKTLRAIGAEVEDGAAVLPEKKKKYSTYASDGATVVKERCSFDGDVEIDGVPCEWSSVLSYDYTTQIVTGNLSDTVRVIYVYLTEK